MTKHTGKWIGLMVHHSAGKTTDTVESIRAIHKKQGWGDIGYHYVLEIKNGRGYLKKGRDTTYNGAHAGVGYYNNNYLGICVPGNYSKETMPEQLYLDLIGAIAHIIQKFDLSKLRGHREVKATECPGMKINLDRLRSDVNYRLEHTGKKITK